MNRPKFSLGSWAFSFGPFENDPWSFEAFLKYAAEAGYDGVEINGFHPHPHPDVFDTASKCKELQAKIQGYGLGISGYAPDFRETPPAEVTSNAYLKELRKSLEFCTRTGIQTLRIDTISHPAVLNAREYDKMFRQLATTWHDAAMICAQEGVKLVWEFEPGFWLNKPREILNILEAVDHENFQVLFDTSHAYMCAVVGARQSGEQDILLGGVIELATSLKGKIGHFHLIDSDGTLHDDETSTHTPFGQGHIDFVEVIRSMRSEVEPLEWWCFDFCFCPTTEEDAKKAIPFVENVINKVV